MTGKDISHVISGFKSVLSRHDTSEEAKAHARAIFAGAREQRVTSSSRFGRVEICLQLEGDGTTSVQGVDNHAKGAQDVSTDEHAHRVAGGYRATLHRDDVSDEAKEHARQELEKMGEPLEKPQHDNLSQEAIKLHRIQGGMKAAIANENVSPGRKDELRATLDAQGVHDHQ